MIKKSLLLAVLIAAVSFAGVYATTAKADDGGSPLNATLFVAITDIEINFWGTSGWATTREELQGQVVASNLPELAANGVAINQRSFEQFTGDPTQGGVPIRGFSRGDLTLVDASGVTFLARYFGRVSSTAQCPFLTQGRFWTQSGSPIDADGNFTSCLAPDPGLGTIAGTIDVDGTIFSDDDDD